MTNKEVSVAALVVLGGLGVGLLTSAASFVRRHVAAEPASADAAEIEIESQAARFAGQPPLREVRDGQAAVPHPPLKAAQGRGRSLKALISDVPARRVVRVDVPVAALRVLKRGGFRYLGELTPLLADTEFEADRVDLRLEDIDRPGPVLLVDHAHANRARILVWVE